MDKKHWGKWLVAATVGDVAIMVGLLWCGWYLSFIAMFLVEAASLAHIEALLADED